ncbi:response regulator [Tessaracoccus sp.]
MAVGVLLVDDHPVVRTGLRAVIGSRPGVVILGEAATGEEGVILAGHLRPDVVLCDLRLGDGMDGVEATTALRALDPAPAVIILTTFDRDADILRAIEAGAAGYLLKDVSATTIVEAIHAASRGEMVLAPELATRVMRGMRNSTPRLTQRELEVLQHLSTGASNREIAKALFVSEATIKSHLVHIFTKLDVDSRARAIHVATESGILHPKH